MMKYTCLFLITLFFSLVACDFSPSNEATLQVQQEEIEDVIITEQDYLDANQNILAAIKNKDWDALTEWFHPTEGVCFSPYTYFQKNKSVCLSQDAFLADANSDNTFVWGTYDGIGGDISLTIQEYFDEMLYSVDFLEQGKAQLNEFISGGNTINNIEEAFPDYDFVDNYVEGSAQYSGMDWQALRLIFKTEGHKIYLIALINDRWTT